MSVTLAKLSLENKNEADLFVSDMGSLVKGSDLNGTSLRTRF